MTSSLPRKCSTAELYGRTKLATQTRNPYPKVNPLSLERVMGIEPTSSAWKAEVLPLNYTRLTNSMSASALIPLVEGVGFEPTKAEPADLQSAPVGPLGYPSKREPEIIILNGLNCQFNYVSFTCYHHK